MKCPHCHRIIPKGTKFCPYCGARIANYRFSRPKTVKMTTMNGMPQYTNPHKITTKAKLLMAGLVAAVVIGGGATIHHVNYIHSPQSVNLTKALNNHVVKSSSMSYENSSDHALNNLLHSPYFQGSDSQLGSDAEVALDNGSVNSYSSSDGDNNTNSDNNNSDANPIGYYVTKNTITFENNGITQSDANNNSDSDDNWTSDAEHKLTFKLSRVSDGGHELIFKPYSESRPQHDNGTPYVYSNKFQNKKSRWLHLHVGKKIDQQ